MYKIITTRARHDSSHCDLDSKQEEVVDIAHTVAWAYMIYDRVAAEFALEGTDLAHVRVEPPLPERAVDPDRPF